MEEVKKRILEEVNKLIIIKGWIKEATNNYFYSNKDGNKILFGVKNDRVWLKVGEKFVNNHNIKCDGDINKMVNNVDKYIDEYIKIK